MSKLFRVNIPALHRVSSEMNVGGKRSILCGLLFAVLAFLPVSAFAQYSANIQGTVLDPAGSAVSGAKLHLISANTGQDWSAVSDATGGYRFLSLAPGDYRIEAQATGFSKTTVAVTLTTDQTMAVPVTLSVASANVTVAVTGEPPVLDTAETRNEMTLEQHSVDSMPLAARDLTTLITMAPGVTGLGLVTGGTPGSSNDNFSTEQQTDSSANGQGAMANMFIVDGLDITSAIRPGVLNLQPNPDSVQEVSIQVNTYTVDYGRASSMQMVITTKGGGEKFHGSASDYFTNQSLWTASDFNTKSQFGKYHGNNMSGTVGGPVWPLKQTFFFASIEPLRSVTASSGSNFSFEDPALVAWAKTAYPNTVGTQILTTYPAKVTSSSPSLTMAQAGMGAYCGGDGQLACDATAIDTGTWASSSPRNGTQWNLRLDKNFANDRLYGDIYKGNLTSGTPEARPAFSWVANTWTLAWQGNETHTFSANTINEASVAGMRVEGIQESGGEFKVPSITVGSLSGTGGNSAFGDGFAQGDFIQHNYHWRDVLTHIQGNHTMKLGYEGWTGDDVEEFQGPHDQPSFNFNNLGDMIATDTSKPKAVQPYSEGGVAYDPLTGAHQEWQWNAASITGGVFFEDTWKMRRNLTVNYGIRWDDMGNPYPRSAETVFGNFYMGPGQSFTDKVANGFIVQKNHALNRAITDILSPRAGIAWDVFGNSKWVLHGGGGVYHNWPTPANVQEEMRGNPPGGIYPNFYGSDAGSASGKPSPIFGLGTGEKPPFGFTYPTLPPYVLNGQGGFTTLVVPINGINPNLQTPVTYIESVKVEHPLTRSFVASVGYSGATSHKLLSGGGNPGNVSYGVDINAMPNDPGVLAGTTPVRYNKSFGTIGYTNNTAHSTFNEFVADVHGRFAGTGFVDVSYTRSSSKDDSQVYPDNTNPQRYFGPSNWDAPNRISSTFSYDLRGLNKGEGVVGRATGGWGVSGTVIGQSGYPFTVSSTNTYNVKGYISIPATDTTPPIPAICGAGLTAYKVPCGDYNADGESNDYPNVTSYTQLKGRKNFLPNTKDFIGAGGTGGIFPNAATQFTQPTVGTEGNENANLFRSPGFFETNASFHKLTIIHEKISTEFRVEIFNLFNHPNLDAPDSNVNDGPAFGVSGGQHEQRWIQLGANIKF